MARTPDCWIFDLDMTLYAERDELFPQIERRMGRYVERLTGLAPDAARDLQKKYWREYGTTLAGLMTHHGVDPLDYLDFVHDIDLSGLERAPGLARLIADLPGRKLVFTNGDRRHAARILEARGLEGLFEAVHDIADCNYRPKPHPDSFATLIDTYAFDPHGAIMFDDSAANLETAKQLGMATVWIKRPVEAGGPADTPDHVDHRTDDLECWLESWQRGRNQL